MIKRAIQALIGWHRLSPRAKYLAAYRVSGVIANLISVFPVPLPRLLRRFGSDKERPGWHSYGATYQMLFRPLKYRPVRLLEIGVGGYGGALGGTSLLAWQAFFPFGTIHGADIEDKTALSGGRRRVLIVDQTSAPQLAELGRSRGPFDIVIDDGSHMSVNQIATFERLIGSVTDGGLYVVEDVQTSFWPGNVGGVVWDGAAIDDPRFARTCVGYFLELSKYLNQCEFLETSAIDPHLAALARNIRRISFEHNLIIIRTGENGGASAFVGRGSA